MLAFLLNAPVSPRSCEDVSLMWKCSPTSFYSSPYYSVCGDCQGRLLDRALERGGALGGLGLSTASVHHVAVLRYWTVAALGLTSFSGKGLLCGVERWSTSQPLQGVGTLPLQQETDKLVTLLSHLATAREQTHITENFGFGPHHINRWQWSLMMGVRLFLEI